MVRSSAFLLVFGLLLACVEPATENPGTEAPAARGVQAMVADANEVVTTLTAAEAASLVGDPGVAFVDLREQVEIQRSGYVPGAVHAPRGLLEFFVDRTSRMHIPVFSSGKRIVFYCAGGGRSALAARTAMEMGLDDVAHVGGGFRAWVEAGGPVERPVQTP